MRVYAFFWQKQKDEGPPRPRNTFSREDLKRIKSRGPTLEDITVHLTVEDQAGTVDKVPIVRKYEFIPPSVLGDSYKGELPSPQPNWEELPQMNKTQFLSGLRSRNWTQVTYKPDAPKWKLTMWKCGRRRLEFQRWAGTRVVIEEEGMPTRWCNLEMPGRETYIGDYAGGKSLGGPWQCVSGVLAAVQYKPCACIQMTRSQLRVLVATSA